MSRTATTNYGWQMPDNASENNAWGTDLIEVFNKASGPAGIDVVVKGIDTVASAALPKAGGTMTGLVKTKGAAETVNPKGNISGAVSFDLSLGQFITCTVTGTVTSVTFTNVPTTGFATPIILKITNGQSSGAWTWGSSFKWASAAQPVLTSTGVDLVSLVTHDGGTTYYQAGVTLNLS